MFPPLRTNRRGEFHSRNTADYLASGLVEPSFRGPVSVPEAERPRDLSSPSGLLRSYLFSPVVD
jgi:hypothetical protein